MKREQLPDALLRRANPAAVDPTIVRSPRAIATLERILAEPREGPEGSSRRHAAGEPADGRGPRGRIVLGAAGITAVAAAIIVVAIASSAGRPAFAGWTGTPTSSPPGRTADAIERCGLRSPVLVEARGPYTAAVFRSPSGGSACIEGPSVSLVASIGGERAPARNQIGTAVLVGSDRQGHRFTLLAGRAGSAVQSIVVHRSNHVQVTASIARGWYLAWWPDRAHATAASVTTSTGVHEVSLPALATAASPPCRGSCAAVQAGSGGSAGVPGPPLIGGPLARPFDHILLLQVDNALSVLVCLHPPTSAALQPNGPTGPCRHATRLSHLPARYPVQKNLLEVFPNSVWEVKLPPATSASLTSNFLVVAFGGARYGQTRTEIILSP